MNDTIEQTRAWSVENVQDLQNLAREKVPASVIALRLRRSQQDVRAKATELGLSLPAE
ncbi:hypothetical protein GCM10008171_02750 [Methylopila jiangsuensis]|uniref:Uncharacterized protein n=1 Tax=Methylopila jiangsuensis TaxID=586230 RepID=A0A9W6JEM6_9HYPH|nr:hypothetical protein [Methylopila jiangsuensis]MDR6287441.1 ribosomal protein L32E [Methylopila jiangsuensis]GLK75021.1 hypothetical protein GCM10008171_02750 [Methylopila jiangsuensis]